MSYVTPGAIFALSTVLPVLGGASVVLRFYTRKVQKARVMMDDW